MREINFELIALHTTDSVRSSKRLGPQRNLSTDTMSLEKAHPGVEQTR